MASQPGGAAVARSPPGAPKKSPFWSCFSCRMLSGGGLAAAGLWVHLGVRRSLKQRVPASPWDVFRLVFAVGLYSWAIVIIVDPAGKK
ncbi:distal membrane-arm assembly complex protein 1 [Liasis olivaceus]